MMRLGKIAVVLASGLALNSGFCAAKPAAVASPAPAAAPVNNPSLDNGSASDNPYAAIAVRNIFGLNPPVAVTNVIDPGDNLPKITPQGIMGVYGSFQVLFKVSPPKPAAADKDQYYILSEGMRQDDIEVVKIDYDKSVVTFDNHGTPQELPLAEASASGGAAPSGGGGSSNPTMPVRQAIGGGSPPPAAFGGASPPPATSWGNNNPWANNNPGGAPGGAGDTAGGLNFGGSVQGRIYQPETTTVPPEVVQISLAGNHLKAIQDKDPSAPLFPPSAIDKEAGIPSNVEGVNNGPATPPNP